MEHKRKRISRSLFQLQHKDSSNSPSSSRVRLLHPPSSNQSSDSEWTQDDGEPPEPSVSLRTESTGVLPASIRSLTPLTRRERHFSHTCPLEPVVFSVRALFLFIGRKKCGSRERLADIGFVSKMVEFAVGSKSKERKGISLPLLRSTSQGISQLTIQSRVEYKSNS